MGKYAEKELKIERLGEWVYYGMMLLNDHPCIGYKYFAEEHKIVVPPHFPRKTGDIVCLLHEIGHALYRHTVKEGAEMIIQEKLAWDYAFGCVKSKYHPGVKRLMDSCLGEYKIN